MSQPVYFPPLETLSLPCVEPDPTKKDICASNNNTYLSVPTPTTTPEEEEDEDEEKDDLLHNLLYKIKDLQSQLISFRPESPSEAHQQARLLTQLFDLEFIRAKGQILFSLDPETDPDEYQRIKGLVVAALVAYKKTHHPQ